MTVERNAGDPVPKTRSCTCRAVLAALALAAGLATCSVAAAGSEPPISTRLVLTDVWDMPIALNMIPAGKPTLFLVCDPAQVRCREGAVYFDTQAGRIGAAGARPACIFEAEPEATREAASRMGLGVPVYADASGGVPSRLLGSEVLPALVLLDGKGRLVRTAVGGGEALDANITAMLEQIGPSPWRSRILVLIPLAVLGIILLVVN
jgi:hypothetical protein